MSLYSITIKTSEGQSRSLELYKSKILLIVNIPMIARHLPETQELEKLYNRYREQGFVVLGFPCDQFSDEGAEPIQPATPEGSKAQFVFPVFYKLFVNGPQMHPLYKHLKQNSKGPIAAEAISEVFTKFLIGKDGYLVRRFRADASIHIIASEIERLLKH